MNTVISTIDTDLLFSLFQGFQEYHSTGVLSNEHCQSMLNSMNRYSGGKYTAADLEQAVNVELASRYQKLHQVKEVQKISKMSLEEIAEIISKGLAYEQVRWERDVTIEQLHDIGCELGRKMDVEKKYILIEVENQSISEPDYYSTYEEAYTEMKRRYKELIEKGDNTCISNWNAAIEADNYGIDWRIFEMPGRNSCV